MNAITAPSKPVYSAQFINGKPCLTCSLHNVPHEMPSIELVEDLASRLNEVTEKYFSEKYGKKNLREVS
jgi:hypothetical protein